VGLGAAFGGRWFALRQTSPSRPHHLFDVPVEEKSLAVVDHLKIIVLQVGYLAGLDESWVKKFG
jgi:hypothetical protein